MNNILAITFYLDNYDLPVKEIVVYSESYMKPAPRGREGIWEYFDVHEPLDDIHIYAVDENGFIYALSSSGVNLCSQKTCKMDGIWYNREERLKNNS